MVTFAADAATGWALAGYIFLILLMIGVIFAIGYGLYRFGMWFLQIWFVDRLSLADSADPQAD